MHVDRLDHLVLAVRDPDATRAFDQRALGMEPTTFGRGRKALRFGSRKRNLHEAGREIEPKATHPVPGSADLCFLTAIPLAEVVDHLRSAGVAEGPIRSIDLRDPDGNLVEFANRATPGAAG